jgi:hypothetical protein
VWIRIGSGFSKCLSPDSVNVCTHIRLNLDPKHWKIIKTEAKKFTFSVIYRITLLICKCPNVQGTYPLKPPLPGVGGGEGVAEVLAVRECPALRPGDWVLPSLSMSGTWRSHAVLDQTSVISIRSVGSNFSKAFVSGFETVQIIHSP